MPDPERPMTTPWNTWTRSLEPSTTRTWTLSVSPGAKSGMSLRRLVWSTRSVGFIARRSGGGVVQAGSMRVSAEVPADQAGTRPRSPRGARRKVAVEIELGQQLPVGGVEAPAGVDEVRPEFERAPEGLRAPPARDAAVIARAQHVGHPPAPKIGRARVVRVLEQAVAERLVADRRLVAHHPRDQPAHGLDDQHRRHLAAGEHDVAGRQLPVAEVITYPLVDPLVTPAQQAEALERRQLAGGCLVEASPGRAEVEQRARRPDRFDGREDRLGHQDHARTSAAGGVVERPVGIDGARPQVVDPHVERAGGPRLADQALAGEVTNQAGKDREHVDAHGGGG